MPKTPDTTIYPIFIDAQPTYLKAGAGPTSLLLTPMGTGTLLSYLSDRVSAMPSESLAILTTFEPNPDYKEIICNVCGDGTSVVSAKRFDTLLRRYEPSDWLLITDTRRLPLGEFDPAQLVNNDSGSCQVKHLVELDHSIDSVKEYAILGEDERVCRIQRYYDGTTWLHVTSVSCSFVPAACACLTNGVSFESLMGLRNTLTSAGIPGHDVTLPGRTVDLTNESELLSLSERFIHMTITKALPSTYHSIRKNVHVGQRCNIHPTVQIYGPVIIQENVTVEANATVIGPAVLGADCHVSNNAVVAQCLINPRTVVPQNAKLRHCVFNGKFDKDFTNDLAECRTQQRSSFRAASQLAQGQADIMKVHTGRSCSLYLPIKRVIDKVIALVGVIVLFPLLTIVAGLIKITSRGSTFFTHVREGKNGKLFRCWKFRTMVKGAHRQQRDLYAKNKVDGPQFDLGDDPRITRIGRWLRITNIDELPQLVNILLGHMSLIGPRPSPFRENQICIPWRRARLSVRPGITGLWQLCRHERESGDFHQWIYYDLLYVRHMSFWLDIKILITTLVSLGGRRSVPLSRLIPKHKLNGGI